MWQSARYRRGTLPEEQVRNEPWAYRRGTFESAATEERPMTGRSNSQRRRLDRRAELVDVDRARDSAWWRGLFRGGRHFELEQDGSKVAAASGAISIAA